MSNPFEDAEGSYSVLINGDGQYSLWPAFIEVPAGWTTAVSNSPRDACVDYIDRNWADLRPRSLVDLEDDSK